MKITCDWGPEAKTNNVKMWEMGASSPCRVQGQPCSCSCVIGGLMETPPAGDGHGWLFSPPCVFSEAQDVMPSAKRRVEAWPRWCLAGFPSAARQSQTIPLNTGWRAQSQTAPGNNRPACFCAVCCISSWTLAIFSKQTACHKLILNVVLSLCNHQLVWVVNLINGFLVLFR